MLHTVQSRLPWETVDLVQGPESSWKTGQTDSFCSSKFHEALWQPERLPTTSAPKANDARERREDSSGAPTDISGVGYIWNPEPQTSQDSGLGTMIPSVWVKFRSFSCATPERGARGLRRRHR